VNDNKAVVAMASTPRLPPISPRGMATEPKYPVRFVALSTRDYEIRRLQMANLSPRIDVASGRIGALPPPGPRGCAGPANTPARKQAFTKSLLRFAAPEEEAEERERRRRAEMAQQAEERKIRMEAIRKRDEAKRAERKRRKERKMASATAIQSRYRGKLSRDAVAEARERRQEVMAEEELNNKASVIQSMLRGRKGRGEASAAKRHRMDLAAWTAARFVQFRWRTYRREKQRLLDTLRRNEEYFEEMRQQLRLDAAKTIQKIFRKLKGHEQPKLYNIVTTAQKSAIATIQQAIRKRNKTNPKLGGGSGHVRVRGADKKGRNDYSTRGDSKKVSLKRRNSMRVAGGFVAHIARDKTAESAS